MLVTVTSSFFILVLRVLTYFKGMHLESFSRKNFYIPKLTLSYSSELIIHNISSKAKSKSHMNIWVSKNISKWNIRGSVLVPQELLNLEYI